MTFTTLTGQIIKTHKPSMIMRLHYPSQPLKYVVEILEAEGLIETFEISELEYDRLCSDRELHL
jgi:hypothetical protein